eukprot:SAG11_NODE_1847_length_4171_cov_4.518664_2_plen_192_part_00
MEGGARLTAHVGTTNMRLKCQLALELPVRYRHAAPPCGRSIKLDASCIWPTTYPLRLAGARPSVRAQPAAAGGAWLEVGGERRWWAEAGELMAFDDSYLHTATNEAPLPRVVLGAARGRRGPSPPLSSPSRRRRRLVLAPGAGGSGWRRRWSRGALSLSVAAARICSSDMAGRSASGFAVAPTLVRNVCYQ